MKIALTIGLLIISNIVMTFAWYGSLRKPGQETSPTDWPKLIVMSWGLAFFEYCFLVPGNHIGRSCGLSLAQLKIAQEVITLSVFVPFMLFVMGEHWKWDYLWAFLCVLGAVFFINREALMAS